MATTTTLRNVIDASGWSAHTGGDTSGSVSVYGAGSFGECTLKTRRAGEVTIVASKECPQPPAEPAGWLLSEERHRGPASFSFQPLTDAEARRVERVKAAADHQVVTAALEATSVIDVVHLAEFVRLLRFELAFTQHKTNQYAMPAMRDALLTMATVHKSDAVVSVVDSVVDGRIR